MPPRVFTVVGCRSDARRPLGVLSAVGSQKQRPFGCKRGPKGNRRATRGKQRTDRDDKVV